MPTIRKIFLNILKAIRFFFDKNKAQAKFSIIFYFVSKFC